MLIFQTKGHNYLWKALSSAREQAQFLSSKIKTMKNKNDLTEISIIGIIKPYI